jgi:hypothetical protein
MGSDLDLDILDDGDGDHESPWTEDVSRGRTPPAKDRDCRRAIEDLREERRLRALLTDFDDDDED